MQRWVYSYELVDGSPERLAAILRAHVVDLLRAATDTPAGPPAVDGSFSLRLDATLAGTAASKDVRTTTGVASVEGRRVRIPLAWHAEPAAHAFPAFEGAIELEALSDRHAQLTLVGAYTVPLGPVGAVFDGLALGGVAQRTIRSLTNRLGQRLEAQHAAGEAGAAAPEPDPERPPVTLRVRDVMTSDPMVFDESLSLRSAALLLVYRGVQGAPVVSPTGALVGVVSEHDLLEKEAAVLPYAGRRAADRERRRTALTVGEACTRPARVTVPDATLRSAARTMLDHNTARLVVVDGSAIAGILTRHDVLKALLRSDAELQAAVDSVLADLGEPEVRGNVVWGEVALEGVATARSKIPRLLRQVAEIDGIVAVHGTPTHARDDAATTVYG